MLKIDLHLHSSFSDGVLSPENLALLLRTKRVSVASLTDHDTVEGVERFLSRCRKFAIRGIAGVELSAAHDGILHVLGYRFDPANEALRAALEQNRQARDARNVLICEKLRDLGFSISIEEVKACAGSQGDGKAVGRPHMARVLWNKGYVPNVKAAFDKYLGRGKAAYVSRPLLPPEECIRVIRQAGGLPVLAHPRQTTAELDQLPPILGRLKNEGLWGLECWSPGNKAAEIYRCLQIAASFDLAPTAGSDFHGSGHSSVPVGVVVREDLLPWAHLCGGL
ncbi:MAG: PHP domain-containing protein [Synergistaceae bacterium]|nr:PHP domain-containing protein [Synergistaceae bacterium]